MTPNSLLEQLMYGPECFERLIILYFVEYLFKFAKFKLKTNQIAITYIQTAFTKKMKLEFQTSKRNDIVIFDIYQMILGKKQKKKQKLQKAEECKGINKKYL